MKPITLHAGELMLRPPDLEDVEAIVVACQDPGIRRWIPVPVPYTETDATDYVLGTCETGWRNGTTCTWAIEREGAFCGVIGLDRIGEGSATIGYWATPGARGRGTVTAAGEKVLEFAFAQAAPGLNLRRVEWRASVGNLASAAVAQHLGFAFEGTARGSGVVRGRRDDEWVAGLLSADERGLRRWPGLA